MSDLDPFARSRYAGTGSELPRGRHAGPQTYKVRDSRRFRPAVDGPTGTPLRGRALRKEVRRIKRAGKRHVSGLDITLRLFAAAAVVGLIAAIIYYGLA